MAIPEDALVKLRPRLRFKAQYQLGVWCPDVDDVVQETMARLLRAEQEGVIRSPDAWVAFANATCNNVIHEYRRRLWREAAEESSTVNQQSASQLEALETHELVERVMVTLSVRDQLILRAFYLEEKSIDQICAETGINRAHFAVSLFRAKERFRKMLRPKMKSAEAGCHY